MFLEDSVICSWLLCWNEKFNFGHSEYG